MNIQPLAKRRDQVSLSPALIRDAYSIDRNRNYQPGFGNIKYLHVPNTINFDLNEGEYEDKPQFNSRERIKQLTAYIMDNSRSIMRGKRVDADFVCSRGVLRYLMATPYNRNKAWVIEAVRFKETIYMCLLPSDENGDNMQQQPPETENARNFRRYGFKFESHVMSDHPGRAPKGSSEPVVEAEEFCVVMSRTVGSHAILFGSEIDGVKSDRVIETVSDLKSVKLVEVKTRCREPFLTRSKVIEWYCQAAIADIDEIYVGVREREGIISDVKIVNVVEEAQKQNGFEIAVCRSFLNLFLKQVSADMGDLDDPFTLFRYTWDPNTTAMPKTVQLEKTATDDFFDYHFVEFMENL